MTEASEAKVACRKGRDCLWPGCGPQCPNLGRPAHPAPGERTK